MLDDDIADDIHPLFHGAPVTTEFKKLRKRIVREARDAIEEVIEPYLLQQGLIQRTPRGRMLAAKAWRHLGLEAPRAPDPRPAPQGDLFEG